MSRVIVRYYFFKCLNIGVFLYLLVSNSYAYSVEDYKAEYAEDYASYVDPIKVPESSISWEVFALTKENYECGVGADGFDYCLTRPTYADAVKKLANQVIEVTGYMFPLEASDKQQNFLIGPYPVSCPFHYHSKPSQVIEVIAKKPIDFSYEPITIKGKLSIDFDEDKGSFYYLMLD